jgi:uncharacterized RDD family membrane protein YckC
VTAHRVALAVRRIAANAVDLMLGMVLAYALSGTAVGFYFASRAVVMLRIGAPETVWKGAIPMIMGILGPFVYGLPFAILIVLLAEPSVGISPGKRLFGLRVRSRGAGAPSRAQYWRRAIIKSAPFWGLTLALVAGSWQLALAFSIAGLALLADVALSLFTSRPAVHDAVSATVLSSRHVADG